MVSAGFLYPGYAAEDDYPHLSRLLNARLPLVHTTIGEDLHTVDALRETGRHERLAEGALRLDGVDSVMWACTSGSFVFGLEGARDQVERLEEVAGVPTSSTSLAFVNALEHLGISKVGVSATYPSALASHFTGFLKEAGVEVVTWADHDIMTAAGAGTLDRDAVLALAAAGNHPAAQAVLLPDTALHTARWLDDLERHVSKPVLTANQVTVWEGLRLAGDTAPRDGAGALFRERDEVPGRIGDHEQHAGSNPPPVDRRDNL